MKFREKDRNGCRGLCCLCKKRQARYWSTKDRAKRRGPDHDLCEVCYRAILNKVRAERNCNRKEREDDSESQGNGNESCRKDGTTGN